MQPVERFRFRTIGVAVAAVAIVTISAFCALLAIEDIKRPDGVIAEAKNIVDRKVRELKRIARRPLVSGETSRDGGAELSAAGVTIVSTGLIDLRVTRYALLGIPRCPFINPGAIEIDNDGLLLGHCSGRFFKVKLVPNNVIEETGFILPLNFQELLTYAPQARKQPDTSVNVLDLLRLRNGKTAVSYTWWNEESKCFLFSVALLDIYAPEHSLKRVFDAKPCMQPDLDRGEDSNVFNGHQAGGRLTQVSDQTLLVSVGDFTFEGVSHSENFVQDPNTDLGKIIEIDLQRGGNRMISIGHRNPQGLTQTRDGRIFETEHGPQGGDEVNLIRYGANYGWPFETLGVQYGGADWVLAKERGDHSHYQKPMFAFMPSIGISQLMEVNDFAKEWEGDLLVASLTGHTLHRLRLDGDRVLYDEPIRLNQRLRDMVQMQDGRIALLTDDYEILVVEADREGKLQSVISEAPEPVRQVFTKCLECHALSSSDGSGKIPLVGILGRKVASWPDFNYSAGLQAVGGVWTAESLDSFLADPERMAAGTPMASKAVKDPDMRRRVVDLIENLRLPP